MKRLLLMVVSMLLFGQASARDDIHSMVVGGKVLELVENRQLTFRADGQATGVWISPNGASVACLFGTGTDGSGPISVKMCVLPSTGGRAVTLMSLTLTSEDDLSPGFDQWTPDIAILNDPKAVSWSPNSRMIAFPATNITCVEADGEILTSEKRSVVVMTASGTRTAAFALPEEYDLVDGLYWSRDSRRLACVFCDWKLNHMLFHLCVLDIATGKVETIHTSSGSIEIRGWHGDAVLCCIQDEQKVLQECEVSLAERSVRTIMATREQVRVSPNGERLLPLSGETIRIENRITGKVMEIAKSSPHAFLGWSPDSRMIAYMRGLSVEGESRDSDPRLKMLWIACLEEHNMNRMCAALAVDHWSNAWSDDGRKIAYIHRDRAYVAELDWRAPEPYEKLLAGLPLSEDEEKELITNSAKQVGLAVYSYMSDHDDQFPSASTFRTDIEPYLKNTDVMYRPGTDQCIVQYSDLPPISEIKYPSTTPMATFDAGYDWHVVVYVDGHVKVAPKK